MTLEDEAEDPSAAYLRAATRAANEHGFRQVQLNVKSRVVAFVNGRADCRVNVYYTTGTVATCLDHPRQGKTQLFR